MLTGCRRKSSGKTCSI